MIDRFPGCRPDRIFIGKEVAARLEVSRRTVCNWRKAGLIVPCNDNPNRYLYTGQAVNDCWLKITSRNDKPNDN